MKPEIVNSKMTPRFKSYRMSLMALLVMALLGCTQSLVLKTTTDVPVPLATKLPFEVSVYYPEGFRNYVYEENTDERPNWAIQCGESQVALFDQILPSVFSRVVQVDGVSPLNGRNVDAILVPEVVEMQFALPHETRTGMYEAWVKYIVHVYDSEGQPVAEWPVSGYGKTETATFTGRDEGLNIAINSAFRDVGAKLTLGFAKLEPFKQRLAGKQYESSERR
ncbi:MAG: hypothetical protein RQ826_03090 [Xanthomonadales bacterium]|nr:hypothetical protein [Xanthomonadales bacterium]